MIPSPTPSALTVGQLWIAWRKFAKGYYRKPQSRRPTGTLENVRFAFRDVRILFRGLPVKDFTVDHMERVRDRMIHCGKSRRYINEQMSRIRGVFRWGHAHRPSLVPVEVLVSISCVKPLGIGRSPAREKPRLKSVKPEAIRKSLPKMPPVVADMVQVILLTGMRPGEACAMTAAQIDRSNPEVWVYRPEEHKTEHYERERVIYIGPIAQAILRPYILKNQFVAGQPLFSHLRKNSGTKGYYTTDALSQAVRRACKRAGTDKWCPLQLRHTSATTADIEAGHEVARQVLGHSDAKTTQRYYIDEHYEQARRYQAKHG